ncbi:HEAT repeat domain-containing protein [Streptomyces sp. NPDC087532]|uniref:HEAT repeat domain-containing protein n=1 Tax=Streptomyces sp. NPDC087532 TaxID=3365795 RepID=UPI003807F2FE
MGLTRQMVHASESGDPSGKEIWLTEDAETIACWNDDPLLGVSYIEVLGADDAALAEKIRSNLTMDDITKLTTRVSTDRDLDTLMDSLFRTAVIAYSGHDPQAFALLSSALYDPEPLVRRGALLAISVTGWASFIPVVEEVSEQDPEAEVRDQAVRVRNCLDD